MNRFGSFFLCGVLLIGAEAARAQFSSVFLKSPPFIAVAQSGNFNGSNARLTITPAAASRTTFTFASWIRPTSISGGRMLFNSGTSTTNQTQILIGATCTCLTFSHQDGSTAYSHQAAVPTVNQWIHFVVSVDTTQADPNNRVRIWINGIRQTLANGPDGIIPQGFSTYYGRNALLSLGAKWDATFFYSGQMADTYYINGLALGPEAFIRPVGSTIKSISYTGPQAAAFYLQYPGASLGTNALTGGIGNLTNSGVTASALMPY